MREKFANHRQRLAWIGQLPPHQHHQGKAEEEEDQPGESVLDADHLVIGGENIFSPPPELVMLACRAGAMRRRVLAFVFMSILAVRFERSGSVHFRRKLSFQYLERSL